MFARTAKEFVDIENSPVLFEKLKRYVSTNCWINDIDARNPFDKFSGIQRNYFDYVLCTSATLGNFEQKEEQSLPSFRQVAHNMQTATKKGGLVIISAYSENAAPIQQENYRRLGLTGIVDDGQAIRTDEGLYSRRFSEAELADLVVPNTKYTIIKLSPYNNTLLIRT